MANDDAPDAKPTPPRPARRRTVTQVARPYFFTPDGERVELSLDVLGGAPVQVAAEALDAMDADAPQAPRPGTPGAGRAVYSANGCEVVVDMSRDVQVAKRPVRDQPPVAAAAAEPPTPESSAAGPVAPEPLVAELAPAAPPPALAAEPAPAPLAERPPAASVEAPRPAPPARQGPRAEDEEMEQLDRADAAGVEIRSEEIDEILTNMPGGLLRWGTTVVFCTIAVLLAISWFIAYPDVVKGRVTITTPTPPVRLVARAGGEVAQVFAADGAAVKAGQPVLLLRSPASYADVQALSASLGALESALGRGGPLPAVALDRPLTLGPLQTPYSALRQAYSDYLLAHDEAFYARRLAGARAQVSELERLRAQLQAQQTLQEQQLVLAGRARERTRQMVAQRLAATIDGDKAEDEYLQRRYAVENGRTSLINNEVQLNTQRAALLELEQRRSDEGARGMVTLGNAAHALRAAIGAWEQENVLRAPVDGTVSFFRELSANQFVAASEPLVAVIPAARGMLARVTLSGLGAGKVVPGQRVIIRLDGYPYREYGTVEGRVAKISQLAFQKDSRSPEVTYLADVSLPRGLSTSYNRTLQFRQEMVGEADVVAEDLRLIERVFNNLRALRGAK